MKIKVNITRQENATYFGVTIGSTVEVEFEEYIAAVVASEIGNSNLEACKAQAVAARTYAVARGVLKGTAISDSSSVAQAYRASRYNKRTFPNAVQGAQETDGQVLWHNGKLISAVYTASNGGRTVSAQERWGSARAYLIAQNDPWDAAAGKQKNGHGVGMSQTGAAWAGAHGANYRQILSFYYPNAELRADYGNKSLVVAEAETVVVARKALEEIQNSLKAIENILNRGWLNGQL